MAKNPTRPSKSRPATTPKVAKARKTKKGTEEATPKAAKPVRPNVQPRPEAPPPIPADRGTFIDPEMVDGEGLILHREGPPVGKPVRPDKNKTKPRPAKPSHPDVGKQVWMTCRGERPCGGTQAIIAMKAPTPGGGWSVRYTCQKCGTAFTIST